MVVGSLTTLEQMKLHSALRLLRMIVTLNFFLHINLSSLLIPSRKKKGRIKSFHEKTLILK